MKPIGTHWRRSRIKALLSSREAGAALGIKQRSLLNIESGQPQATVSELLAEKAADLYKVPVEHLVSQDDNPVSEPPSKEQEKEANVGPGRDGGSGTKPGKAGKTAPKRLKGVAA